ncbi:MAG: ElyC/SanA/YdcF family protein [Haloferula sp.]|uniref:SanA/YdcF family protein n=1 Tax=Haloferula sp. TaxID=2497595 RepID=UPI00329F784C
MLLFTLLCLGFTFIAWTNVAAVLAGAGKLYNDPERLPDDGVMLVFGCDDRIDGRENLYFRYRIDAAAEVWKAGKARCVIVSGDNRTKYYNEPERMRQALIEKGVPGDKIICDYAGLRTLDSVVRAKEIFGVEKVVFISQQFQNERAAYLAKANGIAEYTGYNARDVEGQGGMKTRLREVGARVKMWLDVKVLGTRPRHLGEMVPLPE